MTSMAAEGRESRESLEPEDINRLGLDVNAAIREGRTNGEAYIDRWYDDERRSAALEFWNRTYAFCVENRTPFVPENI